jgi:DNA processing protein
MTVDYNRELLVVPGSIFSHNHRGVHQFLKLGATPITTPEDILEALAIEVAVTEAEPAPQLSLEEAGIMELLSEPRHRDELIRTSGLSVTDASCLIMHLELRGLITHESYIYRRTRL